MKNYETLIKGAGISVVGLIFSKVISYLKLSVVIAIIASILTFIFSKEIALNIFKKPELVGVLRIFAFVIPLMVSIEIFSNIVLSFKKIVYNVFIRDIGEKVFRLLLVAIFIFLGFSLNWIVLGYVLGSLLTFILFLIVLRKKEFILFDNKIKIISNFKEILIC